ncbi:hypothetical protein C1645_801994 [Glomus cerebriforme]|uniref:GATA-type domain-containing protein n=1 Tax=Glomus cerebriforme TaxID=658196 RepID=A0A397TPY6_9GLOM|nr:hypothetical protein C1645_801994 [Glomus cerebriforme]
MDVMSLCSSSPISNQSVPSLKISHVSSPSLTDTINEKNGSSFPLLTSTAILRSPVSPLHTTTQSPHHDTSSVTVVNHNLCNQSFTPQSHPSRVNYLKPPELISRRSSLTSSSSSLSNLSISQSTNDTSLWPRQLPSLPTTSYHHQSLPPPQYPYIPQSQQQSNNYPRPSTIASDYLSPYATSISSGSIVDNDSPYIQQTTEQSLVKMGKVVDYCNQIAHFALQYRDMKVNHNSSAAIPQITESHLTNIINRAYDVLNIVSGLKGETTARPSSVELSQDEIDWIRKQRVLGTYTRTRYKKRNLAAPPGRCHSCNITETPEWRRGPDGARTLCNACGLHFAKITRERALSAMQQNEQKNLQRQQTASNSSNITSTTSPILDENSSNNNNSSMPTPDNNRKEERISKS